ncbi:MAG: hypothetical protein WBV31_14095, partial [Terriglobales bacterium]
STMVPAIARRAGLRWTHLVNVWLGGAGLLSFLFIHDPNWLLVSMLGIGFAWASILSLPYAIVSDSVPAKTMGVYMGIFNFFIVIPEIVASFGLGWAMQHLLNNNRVAAVVAGGVFFILAAMLTQRVEDPYDLRHPSGSLPGIAAPAKS